MPGYIIHLTEAKMIFNLLKENRKIKENHADKWLQTFSYGALLPDAARKEKKAYSHFWNRGQNSSIVMTPQIEQFLSKYTISIDDPLLLGYLAHLDLDLKFWNEYIKECVEFQDRNRQKTEDIRNLKFVLIKKTDMVISPEEFFSAEYLYGDYTRLNRYLINKYNLIIPEYDENNQCEISEVENENMRIILLDLKRYLTEGEENQTSLRVFSRDSVEKFIEDMAEKFWKNMQGNI